MEKPDIKKPMTGEEVLAMVLNLAHCQGFYSRLYLDLQELRREHPKSYAKTLAAWEAEKFTDPLQVVLYFEEGKHNARKFWKVPVTYAMYGCVEVEAASAAEALRRVKEHPDEFGLPENAEYEEESFRVIPEAEENPDEYVRRAD